MPQITDPMPALESFQKFFREEKPAVQPGTLDPEVFLFVDRVEEGKMRFAYFRHKRRTVTAFVMLIPADPYEGEQCVQLGWAVPPEYRGQGRAKELVAAALAEFKNGIARSGITTFYVEAIVGADNEPSQHVAAATISNSPSKVTDKASGLPALQYLGKIGTDADKP